MTTAPPKVEESIARRTFAAAFDAADRSNDPAWLTDLRRTCLDRFQATGFPTRKDEDWKYTDLRALEREEFVRSDVAAAESAADRLDGAFVVTMSDGRVAAVDDGAPAGLTVRTSNDALSSEALRRTATREGRAKHALTDLNAALFDDALVLEVADGATIDAPIQIVHRTTGAAGERRSAAFPRIVIEVGANARATVVETWVGDDARSFTCAVIDVTVGAGSRLDHVAFGDDGAATVHVGVRRAVVGRDATYASNVVTFGGAKVRNGLYVTLAETGAHCDMLGLYDLDGEQHVDNHTMLDHAVPHTTSRELYKGVLDGKSVGVFFGRILVREDAQQISSDQTNNNLLLSDAALANSTPQLEIYADDVQCRHGSTVGQLEGNELYYLRTRGIPEAVARELLTFAFANEIIDALPVAQLRDRLAHRLTTVPGLTDEHPEPR